MHGPEVAVGECGSPLRRPKTFGEIPYIAPRTVVPERQDLPTSLGPMVRESSALIIRSVEMTGLEPRTSRLKCVTDEASPVPGSFKRGTYCGRTRRPFWPGHGRCRSGLTPSLSCRELHALRPWQQRHRDRSRGASPKSPHWL